MTDEKILKDLIHLCNLEGIYKAWCAEEPLKILQLTKSKSFLASITTEVIERCIHVITFDNEKWPVEGRIEKLREQNKLHTDIKILVSERDDRINLF